MSSENFVTDDFIFYSRSLIKMVNRTKPTGTQLEMYPVNND